MPIFVLRRKEFDFDHHSQWPLYYEWSAQFPLGTITLGKKRCTYTAADTVEPTDTDIKNAIKSRINSLGFEIDLLKSFLAEMLKD
jgi:hypothetical protein